MMGPHSRPRGAARMFAGSAVVILLLASRADADFVSALQAYEAQDFATARAGFLELAELGDGASQFNLAAMALRGDGVPKDIGAAAGWLLAAEQNGYAPNPEVLVQLLKKLSVEQQDAADAIVARYGREALLATVLPTDGSDSCTGWEAASSQFMVKPTYPMNARRDARDGIVIVAFTVGIDGLAQDPQVIASEPSDVFDDEAINAILLSRYRPARFEGRPKERRHSFKMTFKIAKDEGVLWDLPAFKRVKSLADAGHPRAQYLIGLAAWLDPSLEIAHAKAREMILSSAQGGEPQAQYWTALFGGGDCDFGDKAWVWLEHSAKGGEPGAQLELASRLIHKSTVPADLERPRLLLDGVVDTRDGYVLKHAVALAAGVTGADFRDPRLAAKLAKRLESALRTLDPQREEALAAAAALNGDFFKAEKLQTRALSKASKLHWNTSLLEERLASYRAKRTWAGDLFVVPPATTLPAPEGEPATLDPS